MNDKLQAYRTLPAITEAVVREMREDVFEDALVSAAEVRCLINLGRAVPAGDPAWPQFYCEAITDWACRQSAPEGYVSEAVASQLASMLGDQPSTNALELDLLAHLFYNARCVPEILTAHALLAVRAAVLADGRISPRETEALRRFLYAPGGEGRIGITRTEAEIVFDINDAARGGDNDPEWQILFGQAITAYVMSHTGYAAPDRDDALRLEKFIEAPGGMSWRGSRMSAREGFEAAWHGLIGHDADEALRRDMAAERAELQVRGTVLTDQEAQWLARRLRADGMICDTERALVARLKSLAAEQGRPLPFALAALTS